jgi:hypothetical protein
VSHPLIEQKINAEEFLFGALNPNTHVSQITANESN